MAKTTVLLLLLVLVASSSLVAASLYAVVYGTTSDKTVANLLVQKQNDTLIPIFNFHTDPNRFARSLVVNGSRVVTYWDNGFNHSVITVYDIPQRKLLSNVSLHIPNSASGILQAPNGKLYGISRGRTSHELFELLSAFTGDVRTIAKFVHTISPSAQAYFDSNKGIYYAMSSIDGKEAYLEGINVKTGEAFSLPIVKSECYFQNVYFDKQRNRLIVRALTSTRESVIAVANPDTTGCKPLDNHYPNPQLAVRQAVNESEKKLYVSISLLPCAEAVIFTYSIENVKLLEKIILKFGCWHIFNLLWVDE